MRCNERKLLTSLLERVRGKSLSEAVEMMWRGGVFNKIELERLYISTEVHRRVRAGEKKVRAIEQLSEELSCSYEKARAAVYRKKLNKN